MATVYREILFNLFGKEFDVMNRMHGSFHEALVILSCLIAVTVLGILMNKLLRQKNPAIPDSEQWYRSLCGI